ncbi:iron-hydroxamate ABC transporter substrate-binding protein [Paenibacillus protaetiae]|uniref:Iron-hydroxamate ABC transporter substrate-binding protein n=1 Tax=Paenibacillus protaetiae TaxID=2509456 RepID=A0A4P6F6E8_9BACL|nr:iron-hydroxamate ABC transporter substrate-binding protein [Paenibacillus protaetiae]QAY65988.1 iron-hydroxamate ABC transporter substrate-binding protein [Paenibacillus protaetiae]
MFIKKTTRKKWHGFIAVLAIAVLLSACGSNNAANNNNAAGQSPAGNQSTAPEAAERTVTDGMGHQVTIPAHPQHVLASYLEDHLVALNVKPVAQWSVPNGKQDYLQFALEGVPTISYDLPVEQVASFNPDLIIIANESEVQNDLYAQYSKIAPTYVLGDEVNKDWRKALTTIGDLLGQKDEAEQLLAQYDNKAEEVKEKLQEKAAGKKAAAIWLVQKQFYIVGEEQSSGQVLYKDLGLTPPNVTKEIPADSKAIWNSISLEKLAQLDADYIFLVNSDTDVSETLNSKLWQNIPAVKAGNVFQIPATSSWLYSGYVAGGQIIDDVQKFVLKP